MINNTIIALFGFVGLSFGSLLYIHSADPFLTVLKIIFGSIFVLFFPGYFLVLYIFGKKDALESFEIGIFSFVFSILISSLWVMIMTIVKIPITYLSVFGGLTFFSLVSIFYYVYVGNNTYK